MKATEHDPETCGCGNHADYCPFNPASDYYRVPSGRPPRQVLPHTPGDTQTTYEASLASPTERLDEEAERLINNLATAGGVRPFTEYAIDALRKYIGELIQERDTLREHAEIDATMLRNCQRERASLEIAAPSKPSDR